MEDQQQQISDELGVMPTFDAQHEIARRTAFLHGYAKRAKAKCLVLGISGGVDSTTTGLLCQRAARLDRDGGGALRFVAVRLPYGSQADEADAQRALDLIRPDETMIVDIQATSDAMLAQLKGAGLKFVDRAKEDFVLGNIKARQRWSRSTPSPEQGLVWWLAPTMLPKR
jgi:NAD+ synthase